MKLLKGFINSTSWVCFRGTARNVAILVNSMFGHMVPDLKIDILMTSQPESVSQGVDLTGIGTLWKVEGIQTKARKQTLMDKHHCFSNPINNSKVLIYIFRRNIFIDELSSSWIINSCYIGLEFDWIHWFYWTEQTTNY